MKLNDINKLQRVLDEFRKIRPSMRIDVMLAILEVAKKQGVTVQDLVHRWDMTKASASRHLIALEKEEKPGVEGLDLIEVKHDPLDRRTKLTYPNQEMRQLLQRIDSILRS